MDSQKQWNKVLRILQEELTPSNYQGWFKILEVDVVDHEKIVLRTPHTFGKDTVLQRFRPVLDKAIVQALGGPREVSVTVDQVLAQKAKQKKEAEQEEGLFEPQPAFHSSKPSAFNINPRYTIENFVVGLSNNLAYAAAQAVIQNPGISYNPLFIYGTTGVGKTHLMHAIGNAMLSKDPNTKIIYSSSENFTNDFVQSIQTKKTAEFRAKYRSCQLLLIDDVQFIAGRDSTQEEFFHTYNELHSKNTQIVLTSDKPPYELQKLEPRLSSRFQAGLMVDIQTPDVDTRVAILRTKCQERGDKVPEECLNLIAEFTPTNARELEGKLLQIVQTAKARGEELTPDFVREHMGQPTLLPTRVDSKKIISSINHYFNVKMADLTGPRRTKELVLPRQIAMYLLQEELHLPLEKIGEMLGGRDHTTIMHGSEKIKEAALRDREIQRMLIEIKQTFNQP